MNQEERKRQVRNLRAKYSLLSNWSHEINAKLANVVEQREQALKDLHRLTFDCPCVALNSELHIYTAVAQDAAHRNGLELGLVGESLSASRRCSICHGTGKHPATLLDEEEV